MNGMKSHLLFLCLVAGVIMACSHTPSSPSAGPASVQAALPEYWPTNG